ncbi:hypothetical protein ACIGBL_33395 [Streptomyces sp. NPDC085614]|uniref:hypothetical protein n=1 Tax=Streptomyces sp. NPDC085614 TaxID=3365733 RepID=UPI0037CEF542
MDERLTTVDNPLGEPLLGEIIRDIQAEVRAMRQDQGLYVTKEISELKMAEHEKRIAALEEGRRTTQRMVASSFVLPLLVLLVAYAMGLRP